MITTDQLSVTGWIIMKALTIIGLLLYAVYAGIIVRQEQLMSKVLAESTEPIIKTVALIHLIAALAVIFLAFILL